MDLRQEVSRMATVMDRRLPGWWERVDLDRLNMIDCKRCVLGQQPRGYAYHYDLMGAENEFLPQLGPIAFGWGSGQREYWLHEIAVRRHEIALRMLVQPPSVPQESVSPPAPTPNPILAPEPVLVAV